ADGQQRALGACTAASFMVRSMDERLKRGTAADVEGADALGRIEFVAGDGEQVYAKPFHVRGNLSDRLRRIGVQYNAMLARDMAYIANRLDRADLVVGMHHTDKYRPWRNRPPQIAGVDTAKAIDGHDTHGETLLLQETARSDDCWMLNRGGDDVVALGLQ